MNEEQIVEEVNRYLKDESYQYAILIDGEWGCGKTHFVKNRLTKAINSFEKNTTNRKVKYVSLYGCKTIQDIQEAMVWTFANEAKELVNKTNTTRSSEMIDNILSTSKKVINSVKEKFLPNIDIFEVFEDWLPMKKYIFIFDDLERCDCPINELFGFINGLVEHEHTKVILVAYEKEISTKEISAQKEIQYLLAMNNDIEWQEENSSRYNRNNNFNNKKINISELENRRRFLFADEEYDNTYRKIREKIIGVTLHYSPDTNEICKAIITNSGLDKELQNELLKYNDTFFRYMEQYSHHNLRTFQFFISKVSYLYDKLKQILIDEEYKDNVRAFLIEDCFIWCIEYKSNFQMPTDEWEKIRYDVRPKSISVKRYVETGEFIEIDFEQDIEKYIDEQLINKVANNDPFNLLYNEYYCHSQKWCEEQIESMREKLLGNKYPVFAYDKIFIILQRLVDIGFESICIDDFKKLMINNISKMDNLNKVETDSIYFEQKEFKDKIIGYIREINNAIADKKKENKEKSVVEILNDENWADELENIVEEYNLVYESDCIIFSKVNLDKWINIINNAKPDDIFKFRRILNSLYPTDRLREVTCLDDVALIKKLGDKIKPEYMNDLIVRQNLKWLKEQIETIGKLYLDKNED